MHKHQDLKLTAMKSGNTFTRAAALWTETDKTPNRMPACWQLMMENAHRNDIIMLVY